MLAIIGHINACIQQLLVIGKEKWANFVLERNSRQSKGILGQENYTFANNMTSKEREKIFQFLHRIKVHMFIKNEDIFGYKYTRKARLSSERKLKGPEIDLMRKSRKF
jgi:hypothetical protein